jgi:hypothetical protein
MSDELHLLEVKIDPDMEKQLHISTLILRPSRGTEEEEVT